MKQRPIREFFRQFWVLRTLYAWGQVAIAVPPTDYFRIKKLRSIREVFPYSMTGYKRLANVYDLAGRVHDEKVPGAFVECGVWKGGCIGLMAMVARDRGSNRRIVLFDSFEGLPEPTEADGAEAVEYSGGRGGGALKTIDQCVAPLDVVKELFFGRLKIDEKNVEFRKGWFQDTVPGSGPSVGSISILRLDGDWYDSIKICLEGLYDQVVPGGYVVIDDYQFWEGCRKAVDDFLVQRNLKVRMIPIDYSSSYFRKPEA